ncbi:MAG: undecaprenyldiphospho-muramoylpentapeptide beta-N-acetylglucosaminyltransferase [Deltaproteobacteria bacterium CG_4_9_14_3_um_filter_63_12]|nr:MAG: undecaprenyldiphospho-muramoylpentapeptide beta-N-acetylglucosaminyltransferase [Deltaproteobacteria bacterium CG_4_9_14_3_um_filter_63_12]
MKTDRPTVLFAAGGTGGHIYPAIAVADAMRELEPSLEAIFVGTEYGLETQIVPKHGYTLETIDVRFLKGTSPLVKMKHLFLLPRSGWQSWRLLRKYRPSLVVGAGGYASGPVVGIAACTGRNTAILEQNAIPGLTNRLVGRFVDRVFVSFEPERYPFNPKKIRALGNPVRSMVATTADVDRQPGRVNVLIFGGSQGAKSLNEQMPRILASLGEAAGGLSVRHQSGKGRDEAVRKAYEGFAGQSRVGEFIDDMPGAYQWADIIVCRAGATTVAELKAAGKAAILVPFPFAAHNHQEENAKALVDVGAALMVRDSEMEGDRMGALLTMCIEHPETLTKMAKKAAAIAQPRAAQQVAESCLEMMGLREAAPPFRVEQQANATGGTP